MQIINSKEFDLYWNNALRTKEDRKTEKAVKKIIEDIRKNGDKAIYKYAKKWDKSSPQKLEVPFSQAQNAYNELRKNEPELAAALVFAADNICRFSSKQREQFANFETETQNGIYTGQRVIPAQKAAVYAPAGRFPLLSSVLMALIPAFSAGVEEVFFSSPPMEDGLPDKKILATAAIAANAAAGVTSGEKFRIFAIGGAQAIAAFAFGTRSVPRADVIAGPGNKFVATAKKLLYGQVGIDFIAGPSDVLVIADGKTDNSPGGVEKAADFAAADMLAQAEHDGDARARLLVPNMEFAKLVEAKIEKRLESLPTAKTARASLEAGALIVVYDKKEEAVRIANEIAPEHLEIQVENANEWIPLLKNYGSLFIGALSAEALGDYSAGINHTLPTETSARFTGGLSVRHFLKTVTTLRCENGDGYEKARNAAEIIARAEGLEAHALSAALRIKN